MHSRHGKNYNKKYYNKKRKTATIQLGITEFQGKKNLFGEVRNDFTGEKDLKMRLGEFGASVRQERVPGRETAASKGRNMKQHFVTEIKEQNILEFLDYKELWCSKGNDYKR